MKTMKDEKSQDELQKLYEGIFDRQSARASGLTQAAKSLGGNIKKVFTGGTMESLPQSYQAGKAKKIVNVFKNDMKALFGDEWESKFQTLSDELNKVESGSPQQTTQNPTPSAPQPPPVPQPTQQPPPLPKTDATTGSAKEPEATEELPPVPEAKLSDKQKELLSPTRKTPLDRNQFYRLKKRVESEPRVRKSVSRITGKPEGQLNPKATYNYKQKMALRRLIGESNNNAFGDVCKIVI